MGGTSNMEGQSAKALVGSVGACGSVAITDTSATTPTSGYYFFALQVIADAIVTTQTDVTDADNATLSDLTSIPAGTIIYGKWSSITLASGEIIAYNQKIA